MDLLIVCTSRLSEVHILAFLYITFKRIMVDKRKVSKCNFNTIWNSKKKLLPCSLFLSPKIQPHQTWIFLKGENKKRVGLVMKNIEKRSPNPTRSPPPSYVPTARMRGDQEGQLPSSKQPLNTQFFTYVCSPPIPLSPSRHSLSIIRGYSRRLSECIR